MSNEIGSNHTPIVLTQSSAQKEWRGLTMDELKMRRAKSLVRREVGRMSLMNNVNGLRDNVSQNGVRGLLFKDTTVAGLRKTDYAYLGYKAVRLLLKLYLKRKRR